MSKQLKKNQPPKGTRPISDFFVRRSSSISAIDPSSPAPKNDHSNAPLPKQPERISATHKESSSLRIFVPADRARKSSPKNTLNTKTDPSTPGSAPHTRTPQPSDASKARLQSTPHKTSKNNADSDSEQAHIDSVIYVARSPMPSSRHSIHSIPLTSKENLLLSPLQSRPRKKVRLSPESSFAEVDPSVENGKNDLEIHSANNHRDKTWSAQQVEKKAIGDHSKNGAKPQGLDHQPDLDFSVLYEERPSVRDATIPVDDPHEPEILDPATKAARIIAEIKAKAYASVQLVAKEPSTEFKEMLSDSDDEDDVLLVSPGMVKSTGPLSKDDHPRNAGRPTKPTISIPSGPSTCQSPPPTSTLVDDSIALNRPRRLPKDITPQKELTPLTASSSKPKPKKKYDPLDALLKEKEAADKKGHGEEAYRRAEAAISKMALHLQNDDLSDLRYLDEDDTHSISDGSAYPTHSGSDAEGGGEDSLVRKRLFGEERAHEIRDMIKGDKAKREDEKAQEKLAGVSFWVCPEDDAMEVDNGSPPTPPDLVNPFFKLLFDAVTSQDWSRAAVLLTSASGTILSDTSTNLNPMMAYLYELAVYCEDFAVFSASLQVLIQGWKRSSIATLLNSTKFLKTVAGLGAKAPAFAALGWSIPEPTNNMPRELRERRLLRLIEIVRQAARLQRVPLPGASDIITVMVLIANDPTTCPSTYHQLLLAINDLCQAVGAPDELSIDFEHDLCTRLLRYAILLDPVNQAATVNLLASGSGRMQRVARWLAFGLVTGNESIPKDGYSVLPDLHLVLDQFYDPSRSAADPHIGKFEVTRDLDYVDLAFYIQILAVVVTDVPAYVVKERNIGLQPQQSPLGLILKSLDSLHSAIADGRAAHITRSRAKAALKQLSLRIHYQRATAAKEVGTLDSYWSKGRKK